MKEDQEIMLPINREHSSISKKKNQIAEEILKNTQ